MKTVDPALVEQLLTSRARLAPPPTRPAPWAARPVLYDFGGGRPDPDSFPCADLVRATAEALDREGREALTYGNAQGYDGLRDLVCWKTERLEGATISREEVLITNGASQALAVIADAFVDPGDVVVTEAPTFSGTLNIYRRHGAQVVGVPLDDEGMRTDELEARLKELAAAGRRPKLIYTVDNVQNPAGPTLSLRRRQELLALASQYGILVVEDDAYGELRFEGERLPSLYALDQTGIVLRTGTLSKVLGAGVRLGWVMASQEVLPWLMAFKQDWGTNPFVSRVAAYYLREHLEEHVQQLVDIYRRKRDTMLAGLDAGLGSTAVWSHPEGGFFIWLRLPDGTDQERLGALAAERQVSYVPGTSFFPDRSGAEFIRLAYSYATVEAIAEGTGKLCEAIRLARRRPSAVSPVDESR